MDNNEQHKRNGKQLINGNLLQYPGSTLEWFTNNKFSLLSASVAGLAITAATKGISRDLRVKL